MGSLGSVTPLSLSHRQPCQGGGELFATMQTLRLPSSIPAARFNSRTGGCAVSCFFTPGEWETPPRTWFLFCRVNLFRQLSQQTGGYPSFPGNPNIALPCSPTPGGPPCQTVRHRRLLLWAWRCCPRFLNDEGSPIRSCYRGSITRLYDSLSTLHAAISGDDARLASGGGSDLTGRA